MKIVINTKRRTVTVGKSLQFHKDGEGITASLPSGRHCHTWLTVNQLLNEVCECGEIDTSHAEIDLIEEVLLSVFPEMVA
jgi:hypothetical protein